MSGASGRRRHIAPLLALASLAGLAACGKAAVVLQPVTSGDGAASVAAAAGGAVPVALPISRLTVSRVAAGDGAATGLDRRVAVVPTASGLRFLAAPFSDFTSRNVLAVRTVENSQVPISVGNVFTDQTATRIGQIGSVISMVARIAPFGPPGCGATELPEFFVDLNSGAQINAAPRPVPGAGECFRWQITEASAPVPDGSITRGQFQQMLRAGRAAQFWPVPTCRSVRFAISRQDLAEPVISAVLTVADPDRVHLYPLPSDGTLAMHPTCGADLTDKPTDRWSAVFAAMAALDAQVQAVAKTQE